MKFYTSLRRLSGGPQNGFRESFRGVQTPPSARRLNAHLFSLKRTFRPIGGGTHLTTNLLQGRSALRFIREARPAAKIKIRSHLML